MARLTADLGDVLAAYFRMRPGATLDGLLLDLRHGHGSWWAHAAYEVATRGMNDARGMPTNSFDERRAAQRELLERIAPELDAPATALAEMAR